MSLEKSKWRMSQIETSTALFLFQHPTFRLYHLTYALSMKATKGAVAGDDTMTRNLGSERISFESLSHSLGTAATNTTSKFSVGDGFTTRHTEQFEIHPTLKVGDSGVGEHLLADVGDFCYHVAKLKLFVHTAKDCPLFIANNLGE